MMTGSIIRNAIILAIFALVSTALVTLTAHLTADRIQAEKELALSRILHQVLPENVHDNDLYRDCTLATDPELLGTTDAVKVFRARLRGQPVALLIQSVAPDGYNGAIELVVGIDTKLAIIGVRVLAHAETPGLGDQIEYIKTHWLDQFVSKTLKHPVQDRWKVRKDGGDFDALTGATITPRAVVNAVSKTLLFAQLHQHALFLAPKSCDQPIRKGP